MKKLLKLIIIIVMISTSHISLAQDFTKRLNFVLLIDNEIPENAAFEGFL